MFYHEILSRSKPIVDMYLEVQLKDFLDIGAGRKTLVFSQKICKCEISID